MAKKYRVKVVVDSHLDLKEPETKYLIQVREFYGWDSECNATADKEWAYKTCAQMNTPYREAKNIALYLPDAKEAEWVIGAAMEGIERAYGMSNAKYKKMRKLYDDLMKQIKNQK